MTYEGMLAETVTIRGNNGDEIEAYYARPLGAGPFPGVVVIHHAPGWDEWCKEVTRKLAHHGYAAIDPNLYHRAGPGSPDDVAARVRGYAVLKALGFSSQRLVQAVLLHAGLLVVVGLPVALLLTQATTSLMQSFAPLYEIEPFEPAAYIRTILGTLVSAGVGAVAPLRSIGRADPMLAFAEP